MNNRPRSSSALMAAIAALLLAALVAAFAPSMANAQEAAGGDYVVTVALDETQTKTLAVVK